MNASIDHRSPQSTSVPLTTLLDGWLAAGIISAEQARRMAEPDDATVVAERTARGRGTSTLAIEALGYLGGVVVLVSSILIMNLYWRDLSDGIRAAILAGASAALLGAGLATSARLGAVGLRLRSVLWLTSTAAFAALLVQLTGEVLDLDEADVAALSGAGTAAMAAVLWFVHRHLLQQVATMVALMLTAGASIIDLFPDHDLLPGLGVWAVAAAWLLLGWGSVLTPQRVVLPMAAVAMVVGAMITTPADAGFLLAIGTVTLLVALAVLLSDLPLLAVGALGTLNVLPAAVSEWFPDSDAVPFALLGVGLVLVLLAVWTARRHRDRPQDRLRDWSRLPAKAAVASAAAVIAAATAVVTAIGLG